MKYNKFVMILIACGLFSVSLLSAQEVWRESTFEDFIDGTFDDAGANMYVSHKGRIQTINRWDLNGDGNVDILCVNSHPLVEMLDMSIYWGNGKDFSIKNHSYVPADGPMWVTPGDLNRDGKVDLVVANYSNGTWTNMDSYVYYGGLNDRNCKNVSGKWAFYPFKSRVALPSSNAQKAAIGDFNKDGYKDIVFAFSGGYWEYRSKDKKGSLPSRIYWGGRNGFKRDNYTNIITNGATDVAAADLDGDGWFDLVFSNGLSEESFIYYGGITGFSEKRLKKLPAINPQAVEVGDIDNDGLLDVVFANGKGDVSFAYLNQQGQFDSKHRIEFETHTAKDIVIRDFNKDGFTDVFFTNHQFSLTGNPNLANRLIDSYLYYGSRGGFLAKNRKLIQTIGAWGANAADLNKDGWVDLLVCNFQEYYSYEVPSFIYWNSSEGFSLTRRTCLYEHGAQGNAIADFDGDGNLDILITSMMGGSRGDYDPCYLYFGNGEGSYSVNSRIELPGREAYEQAFADMDDDGQVDILLLNRGEVTRRANELWIYWNKHNQFDPWRITGLPSYSGLGVEVADLDRNGYLDIVISNGGALSKDEKGSPLPGSFIYWGEPGGWPVAERTALPVVATRAAAIADMNDDGFLDLVFGQQGNWGDASIFYGNGTRIFSEDRRIRIKGASRTGTPGVADLNKDGLLDIAFAHNKHVMIYYQQKDGTFPQEKSVTIPVQAKTMDVVDVNRDGWLDLICPFYKGQGRRAWYSTVLLGSPRDYSLTNSIKLPTNGGTGSIVSDFNRDGYQDIFFFCHRKDGSDTQIGNFGDHHTSSFLYWGGAAGFTPDNRLEIPSVGAHYDIGVDLGNIKDRGFIFKYMSSPHKIDGKRPIKINWTAETPHRTSIKFQIRVANSKKMLKRAIWLGPGGAATFFTKRNMPIRNISSGKWIQYRAIFDTDNGAYSPILSAVEITLK